MLKNYCAFINFLERDAAENAINALYNKFSLKGQRYRLGWGKLNFDSNKPNNEDTTKMKDIEYTTELPTAEVNNTQSLFGIFDESKTPYYPSMDPKFFGGELKSKKKQKIEMKKDTSD
jgi:hypothetical protein